MHLLFEGLDYATNVTVTKDLLDGTVFDPKLFSLPNKGEYFVVDDKMYEIVRVVRNWELNEIRIQGKKVILATVVSFRESPWISGTVDEVAQWLESTLEATPELLRNAAVYLDIPHERAVSIEEFFGVMGR